MNPKLVARHARLAAMHRLIGLAVAVEIERTQRDRPGDRRFEDAGIDHAALPLDRARLANIDGKELHFFGFRTESTRACAYSSALT